MVILLIDQGGAEFNSAPARRLSAAFGLDLAPTTAGNKQVFGVFEGIWGMAKDVTNWPLLTTK